MNLEKSIKKLEFFRNIALKEGKFEKYVENYNKNKATHIYNSNRIEGSTVTFGDTIKLLKNIFEDDIHYSKLELMEIDGLNNAFERLIYYINNKFDITIDYIKKLHYDIYVYDNYFRGEYRDHGSTSAKYKDKAIYLHFTYIEEEMENLIERFYMEDNYSDIEKVVNFKLDFILIHPFSDGNGRMSRLLLNWALITKGFIPINIMADDRDNYIEVLDRCRIENTNRYFLEYIINILLEEYNKIINSELDWE